MSALMTVITKQKLLQPLYLYLILTADGSDLPLGHLSVDSLKLSQRKLHIIIDRYNLVTSLPVTKSTIQPRLKTGSAPVQWYQQAVSTGGLRWGRGVDCCLISKFQNSRDQVCPQYMESQWSPFC